MILDAYAPVGALDAYAAELAERALAAFTPLPPPPAPSAEGAALAERALEAWLQASPSPARTPAERLRVLRECHERVLRELLRLQAELEDLSRVIEAEEAGQ